MHDLTTRVRALLVCTVLALAGCADDEPGQTLTGPTQVNVARGPQATIHPSRLSPEFLPGLACPAWPGFGIRITITVHATHDLLFHGVRFDFRDRFGGRAVPAAIPVPAPGTPALPHPGAAMTIPAATHLALPFLLRFDCGVPSAGTLGIVVDLTDELGRPASTRLSAVVD